MLWSIHGLNSPPGWRRGSVCWRSEEGLSDKYLSLNFESATESCKTFLHIILVHVSSWLYNFFPKTRILYLPFVSLTKFFHGTIILIIQIYFIFGFYQTHLIMLSRIFNHVQTENSQCNLKL